MKWWNRPERPARPSPSLRHGRHGRTGRSTLTRPPTPAVDSRIERFDVAVSGAADMLRGAWPELREVRFEGAAMPTAESDGTLPRWSLDPAHQRIVIYRVPVERLTRMHGSFGLAGLDLLHHRIAIEGAVIRAAAAYLGRDPWDLGFPPEH